MDNKDIDNIINQTNKDAKVKGISFDATKIVSYALLLGVFILVIVFSLIPVGFDWEKAFTDPDWLTNFAILACLVIFGMVYGDAEGTSFLKNYIYGAFQCAREEFKQTVNKINELKIRGLYAGWLQFYNKKKRKRVYEELMYRYQIHKDYFGVLDIPQEDFNEIANKIHEGKIGVVKVNDKYYKLTENQWQLCNSIRNGEIHVSTIDNDCYFLTENHNAMVDDDKLVMKAVKQKFKNKSLIFTLRLLMLLAVGALMAGFFIDKTQVLTEEAWFALASRLISMFSGVSTGISSAKKNNRIDVFVYKHKIDRNKEFIEDYIEHRYVPLSEEEQAKKEYEAQQVLSETKNEEPQESEVPEIIDNIVKQE